MKSNGYRKCPVCGSEIHGRADKKFCCDDCRIYFNNARYRERYKMVAQDKNLACIYSTATLLYRKKSYFLLKIISATSVVCKILSTFGGYISNSSSHEKTLFCITFIVVGHIDLMC